MLRKEVPLFLLTIGNASQLAAVLNGPFLKGNREPRIAMVGRSNVGKSSLINSLLGGKRQAQVSRTPGKTRAIHFYLWKDAEKIIVDLPGYGYAKAAQAERKRWETFIDAYLKYDTNLEQVVLLLDSRHGPTAIDIEAIKFLCLRNIPVNIVFTKVDLLKTQAERVSRKKQAGQALEKLGFDSSKALWVSDSVHGVVGGGRDGINGPYGIKSLIHTLKKGEG